MKQNFGKSLTMPKKTERDDPLGFFNIRSVAKPFGRKKIEQKSHSVEKNLKGDSLVSSCIVCYEGNLFGSVPCANRYILVSSQNFVEL